MSYNQVWKKFFTYLGFSIWEIRNCKNVLLSTIMGLCCIKELSRKSKNTYDSNFIVGTNSIWKFLLTCFREHWPAIIYRSIEVKHYFSVPTVHFWQIGVWHSYAIPKLFPLLCHPSVLKLSTCEQCSDWWLGYYCSNLYYSNIFCLIWNLQVRKLLIGNSRSNDFISRMNGWLADLEDSFSDLINWNGI